MQKATAVDFDQLLKWLLVFQNANSLFTQSTRHARKCFACYKTSNICKHIHLPVQSGSNRILKEMNRLHREEYMTLIDKIRTIIPNGSISQI
jgi:tRNA-2-methylthio-N6-dimethylallyladenosine synthase